MSSSSDWPCSYNDKLLDGVEVYEGWLENSGASSRGDEGAEDGSECGNLVVW